MDCDDVVGVNGGDVASEGEGAVEKNAKGLIRVMVEVNNLLVAESDMMLFEMIGWF